MGRVEIDEEMVAYQAFKSYLNVFPNLHFETTGLEISNGETTVKISSPRVRDGVHRRVPENHYLAHVYANESNIYDRSDPVDISSPDLSVIAKTILALLDKRIKEKEKE